MFFFSRGRVFPLPPAHTSKSMAPPEHWAINDVIDCISDRLDQSRDAASLRCVSRGLRRAVDGVRAALAPTGGLGLVPSKFAALKALDLSRMSRPIADDAFAAALARLPGLTALVVAGPGCAMLRAEALAPVGEMARLRRLELRGCRRVRWSALGAWHALRLETLALVGLSVTAADAFALAEMLEAGCGEGLTRLVLVSFLFFERGARRRGQLKGKGLRRFIELCRLLA